MTTKHDLSRLGYGFIPTEYLPPGADEYHLPELFRRRVIKLLVGRELLAEDFVSRRSDCS